MPTSRYAQLKEYGGHLSVFEAQKDCKEISKRNGPTFLVDYGAGVKKVCFSQQN